ncbi:MAG: GWxTD domain-containing protein [Acidobacteriota bacterium]|nr:MAG: GWxTD domain-containing protein [Acidobacteriota bacterium]
MRGYLSGVLRSGANLWRRNPGRLAASCLLSALVTLTGSGAASAERDPLTEWIKGPVRYLMSRKEARLFKRLETDPERLEFIRRFWERRDPDPRTPENEARLAFWFRVSQANRQFADTPAPGWRTDRGKIFILLGPPDDIERAHDYDTQQREIAARGLMRWHYYGLERAAIRAVTVIAFVRDSDDDWRLTADPKLSSVFLDLNSPYSEALPPTIELLLDQIPYGGGTMSTAMDLGRLQEVPTERDMLRSAVRSEQFLGTYDGRAAVHSLVDTADTALLAVTVALPKNQLRPEWDGSPIGLSQRFSISAELRPASPETIEVGTIEFPEASFIAEPAPQSDDPWIRFQAVRAVPAGSWRLSALAFDRPGGGAAVIHRDVTVEAPPVRGPRVNGPILARSLIEAGGPADEGTVPFRLRDYLVIPRVDHTLSIEDPFAIYIEVFEPPAIAQPVGLEWQFWRLGEDERATALGQPGRLDDGRGPRAWQFEPGRFAPGSYRVVFTATVPDGQPLIRSLEFVVKDSPAALRRGS